MLDIAHYFNNYIVKNDFFPNDETLALLEQGITVLCQLQTSGARTSHLLASLHKEVHKSRPIIGQF
jgi:hypothetical protein